MENGMPKEELPMTDLSWPADRPYYSVKGITQTSLALILNFNLCTDEERPVLAAKLVQLIRDFGNRMSTGFLGTPNILQALSENGYTDVAYTLLLQEKNPSWLFSVNQGATTMWEHWDSIKEDGTFWSDSMNSFNHYAYGAVFDWIFSTVAGIRAVKPAYQEIALEPNPSKELGFADTTFESRSGFIRSYWYYKGDTVYYEFTVPQGVTANLRLPSGYTAVLTGGTYHFAE
jgi:alpha-L-rhamnosidase